MVGKPSDVARPIVKGSPQYKADITRAHNSGIKEGRQQTRVEILSWLEEKYTRDDAPPRGSADAVAILKLTRELAEFINSLDGK